MKVNLFILPILLLAGSFTFKKEIRECYLDLKKAVDLTAGKPDRLPAESRNSRIVKTETGEVNITCIDGYRILYNNRKGAPFVNLKVEMSDNNAYETDKKNILDNLKYVNTNSAGMETKELIELSFNGYKIYGLSRQSIDSANILGIFVMFPEDGTTVYFYFNNIKPEQRNFKSVDEYKSLRNDFLGEYTNHIRQCDH